ARWRKASSLAPRADPGNAAQSLRRAQWHPEEVAAREHVEHEVAFADEAAARAHDRAFDDVAQLAHVARKGVFPERDQRLGRDAGDALVHALGGPARERQRQLRNVVGVLGEGWNRDGARRQLPVQVLVELSAADALA